MSNKKRIQLECHSSDCPQKHYSLLIDPEQEKSLLALECPYCGTEAEADLAEIRSAINLTLRSGAKPLSVPGIDPRTIIKTRPRSEP